MAKTYRINLRLNADEYEQVKAKAGSQPLARWCANIVLSNQGAVSPRPVKTRYTGLDPKLLRELNSIGNNLNQITRLAHQARRNNSLELWKLTTTLALIEKELGELVMAAKDVS